MIPQNFAEFGKKIWDEAVNIHKKGVKEVVVPIKTEDGGICRVTISQPQYVESYIDPKTLKTKWRHGIKQSDGIIKWDELI